MVSHHITKVAVVSHHVPEVAVVSHHVLAIDSAAFWGKWGGSKGTRREGSKGTLWGVLRVDLAMFWGYSGGVLGPHQGGARKRFVWHAAN